MVAIVTLPATLTFSTLVTRVAAVALMLTGLSGSVASHNEAGVTSLSRSNAFT